MTIKESIDYGIKELNNIEDKFLKVRILLTHFLNVDKNYLLTHDSQVLSQKEERDFKNAIEKLSQNIPLQYITGIQEFYGLQFKVNEELSVLITILLSITSSIFIKVLGNFLTIS